MANKKVSQLVSKPSVLVTDLFPIADPTTGQLFKTTISDLGTAIGSGVSSVNTLVGAVVLDTDDIQELASPTNRWFTDTRARAALSASSPLAYNSGTGVFSIAQANGSTNGFLSSADWTTFNAKQAALSGTGFVKISGTTISYDNSTYLTTSAAASTYLALAGGTLTGALNGTSATFTGDLTISSTNPRIYLTDSDNNPDYFISNTDGTFTIYDVTNSTSRFTIGTTGNGTFGGNLTVGQIIRSGGTSAQFLKADGSVDSSTYLTTGTASSTYLPLAGGTLTGALSGTSASLSSSITASALYVTGMTAGSGAIYYNATVGRLTLANYNANGIVVIEVNGGSTALTLNSDLSATFASTLSATGATLTGALSGTSGTFTGNVSTSNQLRLEPSANATLVIGSRSSQTDFQLYNTGNIFRIYNGSIDALVVNTSGNVGIGTTTPGAALEVYTLNDPTAIFRAFGDVNFHLRGQTNGLTQLFSIRNSGTNAVYLNTQNSVPLAFGVSTGTTGGTTVQQMTITSGGNVGIGTGTPTDSQSFGRALDISSSSFGAAIYLRSTASSTYGWMGYDYTALQTIVAAFGASSGIRFETASAERMRITSGGEVLIAGTTDYGDYKLQVNGNQYIKLSQGAVQIWSNSGSSSINIRTNTGYNSILSFTEEGVSDRWSIGAKSADSNLYFSTGDVLGSIKLTLSNSGAATFSSSVTATSFITSSDYRLKEDLKSINGLEIVNKIKVYDYKWKASKDRMDGVLAHELAEVLPYAVHGIKDGEMMQGVDYSKIVPVMVQAIKDLKAELDTLKNK